MRAPHVLLLCVLGAALLSSVLCNHALGPIACCSGFYQGKLKRAQISSYQLTDPRCPKKAVVFTTQNSQARTAAVLFTSITFSSRHLHRAAMRAPHVLLLCVLGAALLSSVLCNNALGPTACCFRFYKGKLKRAQISSYQWTDPRCPKKGVL
ncbi:unnamed protein product [Pleuronectes platessa]|uniref:Chemokine interleukin-8-like domain-containing protein n=1 Tax=Pleuronectes platessa TaxID=8262 RepID=A0A9N7Y828_PLEPL|nr:unnamed protein product [Pleuronectes platessa]